MRFLEVFQGWNEGRLTQSEAARILGVCGRTFRRYLSRHGENGMDGLLDKRLSQPSHRKAPVDEAMKVVSTYRQIYDGWNVKHFHAWYRREHGGGRSYSWVKKTLQANGAVTRAPKRGAHRKKRESSPLPGMMIHQDGSSHEWVAGVQWDLIVTMDDATNEHYSTFFVEEEGTWSSFRGVEELIAKRGLFCSLYTDRGGHYWNTPEAGGKVDKVNLTQFGRGMKQLGVEMIPAYSPEARGRSERAFRTHQGRLPQELALAGIVDMASANRYLSQTYMPAFNAEFSHPAMEKGSAFVPWVGGPLEDILCETFERTVGSDNCVRFEGLILQIPQDRHRMHYVKAKVTVRRHKDGGVSVSHGPRKLASFDANGKETKNKGKAAALVRARGLAGKAVTGYALHAFPRENQ
jgi:transposase